MHRAVGERGALLGALAPECEVSGGHLQQQLVNRVEEVRGQARRAIGDVELGFDAFDGPHSRRDDGVCRNEAGIVAPHRLIFFEHPDELSEMRGLPFAPGTLALLDDSLQGMKRALEVDDRGQIWPPEGVLGRLVVRRTDEQLVLTELAGQVDQAAFDRSIEFAQRRVILTARHDLVDAHRSK